MILDRSDIYVFTSRLNSPIRSLKVIGNIVSNVDIRGIRNSFMTQIDNIFAQIEASKVYILIIDGLIR